MNALTEKTAVQIVTELKSITNVRAALKASHLHSRWRQMIDEQYLNHLLHKTVEGDVTLIALGFKNNRKTVYNWRTFRAQGYLNSSSFNTCPAVWLETCISRSFTQAKNRMEGKFDDVMTSAMQQGEKNESDCLKFVAVNLCQPRTDLTDEQVHEHVCQDNGRWGPSNKRIFVLEKPPMVRVGPFLGTPDGLVFIFCLATMKLHVTCVEIKTKATPSDTATDGFRKSVLDNNVMVTPDGKIYNNFCGPATCQNKVNTVLTAMALSRGCFTSIVEALTGENRDDVFGMPLS